MGETRKLAAILVADVVGYSRLAAADEDRTLARLRGLRSDLIDSATAANHGRIAKRTADGICSHGARELRHWDRQRDDRIMREYRLSQGARQTSRSITWSSWASAAPGRRAAATRTAGQTPIAKNAPTPTCRGDA